MIKEDKIGPRIKQLRVERKLKLKDFAEATGYTSGYLSKVEKSKKAPPVATLVNLAKGLGVDINAILSEEADKTTFMLFKKSERQTMGSPPGPNYNYPYIPLAAKYPGRKIDPYIMTLPLNSKSSKGYQHKGEEFFFVLEGRCKFTHGETTVIMEEGDCTYYDSSFFHFGVSLGSKEAKCLVVVYNGD